MVETAAGHRHELAGNDAGNGIRRERDSCHTAPVKHHAAPVKVEVQVVKAVLPALGRQVFHFNRVQGQKELGRRVRRGARFLNVGQRVLAEIYVKVGADYRLAVSDQPLRLVAAEVVGDGAGFPGGGAGCRHSSTGREMRRVNEKHGEAGRRPDNAQRTQGR